MLRGLFAMHPMFYAFNAMVEPGPGTSSFFCSDERGEPSFFCDLQAGSTLRPNLRTLRFSRVLRL
jgi:hypothetical protein